MSQVDNPDLEPMAQQLRDALDKERRRGRQGWVKWLVLLVLIPLFVAWWLWPQDRAVNWQVVEIDRGDMVLSATATGNLEPKSEVTVGAEISGRIKAVLVAENDSVTQGAVLARFDTEDLQVSLEQAQAQLALALASVAENEATLAEAKLTEKRNEFVVTHGSGPKSDLDSAIAARQRAEAKLLYAKASVRQAEATVSAAQTQLAKAVITSPITGVVLQRNIEPGSTVAANFQAPELFLLAEDLHEMELHVAIDEADVGLVEAGQTASFTVDAWADRSFEAEVLKVYLYPTVENNVVTYTTLLSVDNSDGQLQPGMTATATITTGAREQILRIPNAALRFQPPSDSNGGGMFMPPGANSDAGNNKTGNAVWVLRDGAPQRVPLRTGHTDGYYTEVLGDTLQVGDKVITGIDS